MVKNLFYSISKKLFPGNNLPVYISEEMSNKRKKILGNYYVPNFYFFRIPISQWEEITDIYRTYLQELRAFIEKEAVRRKCYLVGPPLVEMDIEKNDFQEKPQVKSLFLESALALTGVFCKEISVPIFIGSEGKKLEINSEVAYLGIDEKNQLGMGINLVKRYALLELIEGEVFITELLSAGKVKVNNNEFIRVRLKEGDVVNFDNINLIFSKR